MNNVRVILNVDGSLISRSPINPDWGWYKVEQERATINEDGVARIERLSAIVQGWMKDIRGLNWKEGMVLPGKIIIRESLTPFNKKNPKKDLKIAGESGIVCTLSGAPIYRRYFYNANPNATDQLIAHDNTDEIKEAYAALNAERDDEDLSINETDPFDL